MTALEEAIKAEEEAQTLDDETEADETETEDADDATTAEPETPPAEPEPEPGISQEAIAKAEKAIGAHRRKMGDILGESYVAHDCLLCTGVGFMPELPEPGTVFQLVLEGDEVKFMVQPPEPIVEYKQAPDKETCSECDGYGQVKTGSRTPGGALWQCSRCGGSGFTVKGQPHPGGYVDPGFSIRVEPPAGEPAPVGVPDAWGRPAGHPHWGVSPANVPL